LVQPLFEVFEGRSLGPSDLKHRHNTVYNTWSHSKCTVHSAGTETLARHSHHKCTIHSAGKHTRSRRTFLVYYIMSVITHGVQHTGNLSTFVQGGHTMMDPAIEKHFTCLSAPYIRFNQIKYCRQAMGMHRVTTLH
jgi:hypothetical protein